MLAAPGRVWSGDYLCGLRVEYQCGGRCLRDSGHEVRLGQHCFDDVGARSTQVRPLPASRACLGAVSVSTQWLSV